MFEQRRDDTPTETEHHDLGRRLQRLTIAWNIGEVFVTVTLGVISGSIALVAFGLDSLIEVFTSSVVLWHMNPGVGADRTSRDRQAEKLVALAFGLLAAFLLVAGTRTLILGIEPDSSRPAIAYLSVTALVMIFLAASKRRTGRRLRNEIYLSEARMTQIDAYLAMGILSALVMNTLWGWWWVDPIAAGAIGILALSEAIRGLRREG